MALKSKKRTRKGTSRQKEAYTLSDLEQIKVLADPLRIKILEALCEERTTKQVAELLGEKPTKLYHHVDALERVGLIKLSRTRQNRGTLEKYYQSVARSFRAHARIFEVDEGKRRGEEVETFRRMMSTIFDTTTAELTEIVDQGDAAKSIEGEGILTFVEIRASKKELKRIRDKLNAIVQSLAGGDGQAAESNKTAAHETYRLTLAFYPLDTLKRHPRPED
jgi:DNA-binding transcriptional ArsR family regulator